MAIPSSIPASVIAGGLAHAARMNGQMYVILNYNLPIKLKQFLYKWFPYLSLAAITVLTMAPVTKRVNS